MFKPNGAEHPALAESRKRLALIERRTPPGYPLGYNLHWHRFTCSGCGAKTEFATLTTIDRAGSHSKSYHSTRPEEKVYDLPVDEVNTYYTTPRCHNCVERLAREPIPAMPAYGQNLKPSARRLAALPGDFIGDLEPIKSQTSGPKLTAADILKIMSGK